MWRMYKTESTKQESDLKENNIISPFPEIYNPTSNSFHTCNINIHYAHLYKCTEEVGNITPCIVNHVHIDFHHSEKHK